MAKIYYDSDADLSYVLDKTIAIIGYGKQGRAQALNMRDSGIKNIIIGSRHDESFDQANEDGFQVYSIEDASKMADIIFLLLPDEFAPEIYEKQIAPGLEKGNVVNFASGYNITFKHIVPQADIDVVMVAPRMIGEGVRDMYLRKESSPCFVGVEQDASGCALEIAKALAKAIGGTRKGSIEVSFLDETMLDLMAEQGFWPLVYHVFNETFKLETSKGHPEEAVLMEEYLSKEAMYMMEKAAENGLFGQVPFHSHTSQFGQLTSFAAFDPTPIREFLAKQYENIRNGSFAEVWDKELKVNNLSNLNAMIAESKEKEISQAEQRAFKSLR